MIYETHTTIIAGGCVIRKITVQNRTTLDIRQSPFSGGRPALLDLVSNMASRVASKFPMIGAM
jgi:hypothetical protein